MIDMKSRKNSLTQLAKEENRISVLESELPDLFLKAGREAAQRAQACGLDVFDVRDNQVVQISPDGSCTVLKQLPRHNPSRFALGQKILLKR